MAAFALELHLLGEFRAVAAGRAVPPAAWEHRRAAELVKLLALSRGCRLTRDQVVEALFSHLAHDAGVAALHKAASQARTVLGAAESVVLRGGDVALAPEGRVTTDAAAFEEAARAALASGDEDECARAAGLYGGELLPGDRYAEWAEDPRRRLEARYLDLLRRAGAWEDVVALEPTDERAHMALMRLYAKAGSRAAALRQFRRMREILAAELGVGPGPEAVVLAEEIARGPAVHAPVAPRAAIVGRQVELARALALLRQVREGRGGTLLVRGDPGIGKTRFCEAVLVEAAREGATTLRGEASPDEASGSFAPVIEALERLLLARPELKERVTGPARELIARLAAAPCGLEAPLDRQAVLAAVTKLLTTTAAERPVVLLLDDLHAADASTVQLLHYVARAVRFEPILLLAAYRPAPPAALAKVRAGLLAQRAATEIELAPLSRSECATLVERALSRAPTDAELDALHRRAAGNAFYVEALSTSLAESGEVSVPGTLWDVLDARVDAHGAELARTLSGLAILGDAFTTEEAIALLDAREDAAFALLDRALAARLLDEVSGGYRFHHALVREAFARRLPAHRLREAHRRAADALVSVRGSAARIGRHLVHAGAPEEAVAWLAQAAREQARVGAYATALERVEEAIACGGDAVDLLALRAELLLATGAPEAAAAFEEAIRRARGQRRDALRVGKAQALIALGQMEAAAGALDSVSPPEQGGERLRYLTTRAMTDWMRHDFDAVEAATREAMELAGRAGLPREMAEAAVIRVTAAHMEGSAPSRVRADLLDLSHPHELAAAIHEAYLCGVEVYLYGGQPYEDVVAFAEGLRAAGQQSGARRATALATCLLGEVALLTGSLSRAETLLEEARALSLALRSQGAAALAVQRLAEVALMSGAAALARTRADAALELARSSPIGKRHLLQRVYGTRIRAAGAPSRALAALDEAEAAIQGPLETCFGCTITLAVPAAIACAEAGDLERGRGYLATAEQMAQLFWRAGAWFAAVAEAGAALSAAGGARDDAEEGYRRAEELFAQAGHGLDAQRCRRAAIALR